MTILELLAIAVGLAMDAAAVSLGAAAGGCLRSPGAVFRLVFHFAFFQAVMPLIGWLLGSRLAHVVAAFDHWIAFALLAVVGFRMIRSGLREDHVIHCDPSRGSTLLMLAIATSIDALAVGLSLAMLEVPILMPALVIGLVTAALSWLAIRLGARLGEAYGKRMEIAGGILLMLIGLRILIEHLRA
jgi:putative Mn2+ efflux pump MntP